MDSDRKTKDCRMCYAEIDDRAKVCPVCRYPQTFLKVLIGMVVVLFLAVALLLTFLAIPQLDRAISFPHPDSEVNHADRLQVVQSSMQIEQDKDSELTLLVLGTLKNTAQESLYQVAYEVHVLDAQGQLIDMHTDHYDFTVAANGECPFKSRFPLRDLPRDRFASHRIVFKFAAQGETKNRWGY